MKDVKYTNSDTGFLHKSLVCINLLQKLNQRDLVY